MSKKLKMSDLRDGMNVVATWPDESCPAVLRYRNGEWYLCQNQRDGKLLPKHLKYGKLYSWVLSSDLENYPDMVDLTLYPKTMDDLDTGDILVDAHGSELLVEKISPKIFILIRDPGDPREENAYGIYTLLELKRGNYKLKGSPEDSIVELTLEEVAELKGIPVERLRIKD